jgi:predicted amidophosphoribosyltransferase
MSNPARASAEPAAPAWPSQCELCRQWCARGLCPDCVARFAAPVPRCGRCGLRLGRAAPVCGTCVHEPPPFENTVCAVDYGFPWDHLVSQFKFHSRPELAAALAERLAAAVRQRLAQRGYNQAWELARRVAAALHLPARPDWLHRPLDTAPQAGLARAARQVNLRTAFMVEPGHRSSLAGLRLALVDDVMTTGATAHEAAAPCWRRGRPRRCVGGGPHAGARRCTIEHVRGACSASCSCTPRSRPTPAT